MKMSARSTFIALYPMVAMAAAGLAAYQLVAAGWPPRLAWPGLLLLSAPILGFLGRLMLLEDVARTSDHLPLLYLGGVAGLGLVVADRWSSAPGSMLEQAALPLALLLAGAFVAYDLWYSRLTTARGDDLRVGAPLPELELRGTDGSQVSSRDFLGQRTLLLFYRGNWCPLCMAQIKEVAAAYRELERRGVDVVLVSPQPAGHSATLAARFDAPMGFLVDEGGAAARRLGIDTAEGMPMGMELLGYSQETVLPTVILLERDGTVVYLDQTDNYRVRPEPATFLAVLDRLESPSGASVADATPAG